MKALKRCLKASKDRRPLGLFEWWAIGYCLMSLIALSSLTFLRYSSDSRSYFSPDEAAAHRRGKREWQKGVFAAPFRCLFV